MNKQENIDKLKKLKETTNNEGLKKALQDKIDILTSNKIVEK